MAFSNPTNNPLKDNDGRYRTMSLFYEKRSDSFTPIWTLKDEDYEVDGVTYPSLKKIYFSYDHIPGLEYEFAQETFKSWDHWIKLCNSQLRGIFTEWREELDIKLKASAIRSVIKASSRGDAAGVSAARYIAERGYAAKRGRPSKEELERTKRIEAGVEKELESDIERIGLRLLKG
jgi:hypothetical protein